MRFSKIRNATVRFGAVFKDRKCYGAVRCAFRYCESYAAARFCDKSYDAVRCGSVRFSDMVNPTVRFDFVINPTVRFGVV